ncbi:MAG TPA: cytochrome b N-terminal domain-containing protein [Candidatus Paceibacterota bacterium]|nr:cytochrome b N-terminal domain-containing protein [Candidatus Paceibacterota bacterium]
MDKEREPQKYSKRTNAFKTLRDKIFMHRLPSYGNKIFFSLGFLALTCLTMLVLTGIILAFMGQNWWLHSALGIYVRSVHLWSVQAFIAILVLHVLVALATSGFRAPRRMVWVFGATIFFLVLIQTEFGYGLRGDFSSQYRAVSGADFWNGAYLGYWLNPLNYTQSFAIHVAIIPLAILMLFLGHYILEHTYGISKPYREDIKYKMVDADHRILFIRGGVLAAIILTLALFFHSPYVPAVRISDVAGHDPKLVATTLLSEFDRTSGTATYFDSIDPYNFDTRQVFIAVPYEQYMANGSGSDAWAEFSKEPAGVQQADIKEARMYFNATDTSAFTGTTNPVVAILNTLMPAAKSGLYESLLNQENPSANSTYTLRFLNDTGALEDKATSLNMNTAQWGMTKDETGSLLKLPPGSWWLAPLGLVNTAFNLLNNPYGDRDAGEILGLVILLFILFPYIPYLNRLPEKLNLGRFIWGESKSSGEKDEQKSE